MTAVKCGLDEEVEEVIEYHFPLCLKSLIIILKTEASILKSSFPLWLKRREIGSFRRECPQDREEERERERDGLPLNPNLVDRWIPVVKTTDLEALQCSGPADGGTGGYKESRLISLDVSDQRFYTYS